MNKTLYPYTAKVRIKKRTLLPLVALGGGLAATPAAALELGELTVHSNLGQPLRASIAYALAPNEMLSDSCVSVGGGRSTGGLPGIGKSSVSITDSAIVISGETVVREPMLGTRVTINCPYTPNLSREYMLFVDPQSLAPVIAAAAEPPPIAAAIPQAVARTAPRNTRNTAVDTTPIGQATRYQVKAGETLGEIVGRIENRPVGLWHAVNAVFAANPEAFIDNDPNKVKAGSWLTIPSFDGSTPVVADAPAPVATPVPVAAAPSAEIVDGSVYEPPILEEVSDYEPPVLEEITEVVIDETPVATDSARDLRPGDVVLDSTTVIPDTALQGPTTASASPNVPVASIVAEPVSESSSMLVWLVSGGIAIFGLLVLFGRRIRDRFGSTPVGAASSATASFEQDVTDYDIDDDSPTEENLALDADLVLGTGLAEGTDMDIAQDFGFAATTELDVELPFEPEPVDNETDILPPMGARIESILESEVLPEDDDYDMSVIVDATKMPQSDEVTAHDLKAVAIDEGDETGEIESYTINEEVGYDMLERDYEDELTATQALNLEIERAAAELKNQATEAETEVTAEMPLATVTEIDSTAEMRATEDGDTAALTVNMSADDKTTELQVANDDETAEMEISGGKVG